MIDFDRNATTPLAPAVAAAMGALLVDPGKHGNPSSLHRGGQLARAVVEDGRGTIARALGVDPLEVVFTSGGTEACNLAVLGAARASSDDGRPCGILTAPIEHPAVLKASERWEHRGHARVLLPVEARGRVEPEVVADLLRAHPEVGLISLAAANHELGNANDIAAIVAAVRSVRPEVIVHCDAVQALGKVPVEVPRLGVDLLSISAHKIHGPKGVGALVVRRGTPLCSLGAGGGQEKGLRPGTEPTLLIHGFAVAMDGLVERQPHHYRHMSRLRRRLVAGLVGRVGAVVHGDPEAHVGNTVLASLPGCEGPLLVMALDLEGVCVSSGAACSSGSPEPSPVLRALGVPAEQLHSAIRFSLGPDHGDDDVDTVLRVVERVVPRVRAASRDAALAGLSAAEAMRS